MLDEHGIAKLGDFGSAEKFSKGNDTFRRTGGTYQFLAPECCDRKQLVLADSVGCSLYKGVFRQGC